MARSTPRLVRGRADPNWRPVPPPANGCVHISGDVRTGDYRWCGKARAIRRNGETSPYCMDHSLVCYRDFLGKEKG